MRVSEITISSVRKYRPHIDGLRGIAVLAVILYHADLLGFTGGFIGVDIFFIISGFLITSILLSELRSGGVSLLLFWERRMRRILPAMTVMMLATVVAAYFIILYPPDYHHFASTVIAQSVFGSNILFTISDSYFDQPSRFSPLLHMWTLSLEEQFYLLFPLIALAVTWVARHRKMGAERLLLWVTVGISVLSFAVNIWLVVLKPGTQLPIPFLHGLSPASFATAGYYLLPPRAWELGLGAMAAISAVRIRSRSLAETGTVLGMIAVIAPFFLFDDTTPFPGLAALAPTLGTVLIIIANEEHATSAARVLTSRILVGMGLISYSLYLWHWPLLVFSKILVVGPLSELGKVSVVIATFMLSVVSYRYVETPFRDRRTGIIRTRKMVYVLGLSSMCLMASLGFLMYRGIISNENRIPLPAQQTFSLLNAAKADINKTTCFQSAGDEHQYGGICRVGDSAAPDARFVLWGDSHAQVLMPLFDELGKQEHVQGVVFQMSACIPVTGVWRFPFSDACEKEKSEALRYIADHHIRAVFMIADWSSAVMGGLAESPSARISDGAALSATPADAQSALARHLPEMVATLARQNTLVYIVEQVPEQFDFDIRQAFYRSAFQGKTIDLRGTPVEMNGAFQKRAHEVIDPLAEISGVFVLDPADIFCRGNTCILGHNDTLLYQDDNHVSAAGADLLKPLFLPIFAHEFGARTVR